MTYKKDKIVFFRDGLFSHVNQNMLHILKKEFSQFGVSEIVISEIARRKDLANICVTLKEYGMDFVSRQRRIFDRRLLIRNSYYFEKVRQSVRKVTRNDPILFTFQTQSIWDASTPGLPHFVYTDHTHLSNLRYTHFSKHHLFSNAWINHEREIYKSASLVFVTSNFAKESLVEDYGLKQDKVKCVLSGVNIIRKAPIDEKKLNRKNILFVGLDWERKGGPILAEAFKSLLPHHPDATLTIVGCNPEIDIPNCYSTGIVPREEVCSHYARASIFCLPSNIEPSAAVLVEAAAHGLPVVSTDIGGTRDRVIDGKTGYLVQPGSVEQLAEKLNDLLCDPCKCERFGREGYTLAKTTFTWEIVGQKISNHIREVIMSY